jgi:hypothetical protein
LEAFFGHAGRPSCKGQINTSLWLANECVYRGGKRLIRVDFVEEVGEQFGMNQPGHSKDADCEPLMVSGWVRAWHRYQLGQLSEVLGGCCEKELISRTIWPS